MLGDYLRENGSPGLAWRVLCFVSLRKVRFSLVVSLALREGDAHREGRPGSLKAGLTTDVQMSREHLRAMASVPLEGGEDLRPSSVVPFGLPFPLPFKI